MFFFLYAPIFVLIVYSFNESKSRANWTGFSLKWYKALFEDQYIMDSFYTTLSIGVLSAVIATIIGTAAAIGIYHMRKRNKLLIMNITYLPVLNPDIVTGIALMLLFIVISIPRGFNSLLLSHITFSIPFVIISVLPKLRQISKHSLEAALDLGATPLYAYQKVIIPQISSGIFTGFLLAFTMSIDDFIVSFFTTGGGVSNLAITIYSMARKGINPKINAILTIMFVSVLILLVIINTRMERDAKRTKKLKR